MNMDRLCDFNIRTAIKALIILLITNTLIIENISAQETRFTVAKIKTVDGRELTISDSYILNDTLFYKPYLISRNNIEFEKYPISNVISLKYDPTSGAKYGIFCGGLVSFGWLINFGSNNDMGNPFSLFSVVAFPPLFGYIICRNYKVWQKFDLDSIRPPTGNHNLMLPDRKLGLSIIIPIFWDIPLY